MIMWVLNKFYYFPIIRKVFLPQFIIKSNPKLITIYRIVELTYPLLFWTNWIDKKIKNEGYYILPGGGTERNDEWAINMHFFVEQLNENARLGTEMPIVYFI